MSRYRGGGVARDGGGGDGASNNGGATNSSLDSLDSSSNGSQESNGTHGDSLDEAAGGTETLPCGGNRELSTTVTQSNHEQSSSSFHWTLSNWGAQQVARRRNNAGTVRVDLASPEDISLDTDSTRVVFSAYGTTV